MKRIFTIIFLITVANSYAQFIIINDNTIGNNYGGTQALLMSILNDNGKIQIKNFVTNNVCASCAGPDCYDYNDKNTITLIPNKKITSSETRFLSNELQKTELNNYFVIQDDSSLNNDTIINKVICDSSGLNCFFYNYFKPISYYIDQDSNYNYTGYLVKNECYTNGILYRSIYIKTNKKIENNITSPNKVIQYKVLTTYTILKNNESYQRGNTDIIKTADNQNLILYSKDSIIFQYGIWENSYSNFYATKIDNSNNITYSQNIFKDFETNATYMRSLSSNFFQDSTGISVVGEAEITYLDFIQPAFRFFYKLYFTTNGIFTSIDTFSSYDRYNSYIIANAEKKEYVYYQNTVDSTTLIKYFNAQGDTIKEVTIHALFNHEPAMANDGKYIKIDFETRSDDQTYFIYELFDSTGNKLKHYEKISYESGYFEFASGRAYKYHVLTDSFGNIYFVFNKFYELCEACSPGRRDYQCYVFNQNLVYNVSGTINNDINRNCIKNTNETTVKNVLVELQLNGKKYYTMSNDTGKYIFMPYDTGHGKIILHLENQSVFTDACQDTFDVYISDTLDNPIVNFYLHVPICSGPVPKVSVDISTPFLRRCFDNLYTLTLTNESIDTAFNTYADITLDEDLIPVDTAFLSAQNLGNNTYRFSFGTLLPLQSIRKNLIVNVNCNSASLGETHCVEATSHPYGNCIITDGKYLKAQAICRNDSVVFTISNISFPEIFTQSYRVLADDSVKYTGTFNFTSTQSANSLSYYNPLGKTYRLETRQYPAFIGEDTILSVAIEGCGNSTFSTGFITMFAQDDDQPNVSIDCHKNVGSFDPNDKSANPIGYDDAHLIENTQPVEYTIHFQNLGTYAASFVTVADTLSTDFDITTLKVLGASHDYTVQIFDSTVLKFTFNNINLADAATDSLLSNGFVKFSIKPKENTTIGTEIKNNAFITFDFNDAVETNTVQHEIGKDFLKTSIISLTKNHLYNNIITKIYPNPSTGKFIFEINKELPENVSLHFYSLDGKEIYSKNNLSLQNSISAENWSANIYLFELKTKTELLQSGKIIIQ